MIISIFYKDFFHQNEEHFGFCLMIMEMLLILENIYSDPSKRN